MRRTYYCRQLAIAINRLLIMCFLPPDLFGEAVELMRKAKTSADVLDVAGYMGGIPRGLGDREAAERVLRAALGEDDLRPQISIYLPPLAFGIIAFDI